MNNLVSILLIVLLLSSCNSQNPSAAEGIKEYQLHPKLEDTTFLYGLPNTIEQARIGTVQSIFAHYIDSSALPITAEACRNGNYTAHSPYNDYDYRYEATIKVENRKITAISYDEVHKDGHGKEQDSLYNSYMHGNSKPSYSYAHYRSQLIEKQDVMEVEAVSGATYSLYRFRYTAIKALLKGH